MIAPALPRNARYTFSSLINSLVVPYPIQWGLALLATITINVYFRIFYAAGKTVAYGDAMAKLNLAASVFYNQQGRFSLPQQGGLWPTLQQFPMLPLVWWTPAYRSGLAGSIPAMLWFVIMIIVIYEVTYTLMKSRLAGIAAALTMMLNVNVVYLATTPLSESLTMLALSLTVLFIMRLEETPQSTKWLVYISWALPLNTQIRYEFWFLTGVFVVVMSAGLYLRGVTGHEFLARLATMMVLPALAVALWLLVEWMIYGDPLYFSHSEFSAHYIDIVDGGRTAAIGNVRESLRLYLTIVRWNIPPGIFSLAVVGFVAYVTRLFLRKEKHVGLMYIVGLAVFFPIALYTGQFVVDLSTAYNVRQGTTLMPLVAICVGYLVGFIQQIPLHKGVWMKNVFSVGIIAMIVFSSGSWLARPLDNAIVLRLTNGADPGLNEFIACAQTTGIASDDGLVLTRLVEDMNSVQFKVGIPLTKLITERHPPMFEQVRLAPSESVSWVMIQKGDLVDDERKKYPERYQAFQVFCDTEWGTLLHR